MRPRRHTPARASAAPTRTWVHLVRDIAIVVAVSAVGYLVAAVWISPVPLFEHTAHSTPRLLGLAEADARKELAALGLRPRIGGTRTHPAAPAGAVIWQDPPPGVMLPPNSVVTLTLSVGPSPVPVPDVSGLDTAMARHILGAAGLAVGKIVSANGGAEPGIVIATQPAIGVSRARGSAVGLVVSRGSGGNP